MIVEGKAFNQSAGNPMENDGIKKTFSRKQRRFESGGKDGR